MAMVSQRIHTSTPTRAHTHRDSGDRKTITVSRLNFICIDFFSRSETLLAAINA